jgi:excisionase family DNA binding protein
MVYDFVRLVNGFEGAILDEFIRLCYDGGEVRTAMTQKLLTITQAAERLGIHYQTLRTWADTGKVPVVMLPSGYRRFDPDAIERVRQAMGYDASDAEIVDPRGKPGRPRKSN